MTNPNWDFTPIRGIILFRIKTISDTQANERHHSRDQESHERIQFALNDIWEYSGELFEADEVDQMMLDAGIGVNLAKIKTEWHKNVAEVLESATLEKPADDFMQLGGKQGRHTEYLGFLLAEMQYMQRAYPNSEW